MKNNISFFRKLSQYFLSIIPFIIATVVVSLVWFFSRTTPPNNIISSPSSSPNSPTQITPSLLPSPQPTPSLGNPNASTPKITPSPLLPPSPPPVLPSITPPVIPQPKALETPHHFAYAENRDNLVKVGNYYQREEYLDQEAAAAFLQMKEDAKREGIDLKIISGFRTIDKQRQLFQRQIQRKGGEKAAKRYSAPPGYSEHHTGYTVDIGDSKQPNTDLKVAFQNTEAYAWLANNASNYGFELSFPENNFQGVSFEPWHWRFVGSYKAQIIFQEARSF